MNEDLQHGINDGVFKSLPPDRGGEVEMQDVRERAMMLQAQYDMNDIKMAVVQTAQYN
jgi:hypothetical protein